MPHRVYCPRYSVRIRVELRRRSRREMLSLSGRCSGQAGKMDLHLVRDMYTGLLPVNLIYGGMSGFEMLLYMARINTSPFF